MDQPPKGSFREQRARIAYDAALRREPPDMRKAKVYFIRCEETGRVKIGIAKAPHARLTQIQTMSPTRLSLVLSVKGGRKLEKELHKQFADSWSHGEWFEPNDKLTARMDELSAEKLADGYKP